MSVYSDKIAQDVETLSLKLDEAILRETPSIERGLITLAILAAVTPMLGLLGTVSGMIETFQSITLFGTRRSETDVRWYFTGIGDYGTRAGGSDSYIVNS